MALKNPREAAALAAVAAADKGVQLTPEALERYAAALEAEPPPEPFKDNDGGTGQQYGEGHHNQDEGQDRGRNNQDTDKTDTESAESDGQETEQTGFRGLKDENNEQELEILKNVLRQISKIEKINQNGQTGGQSSLISILNRLPGRDGNYWMVYPFNFLVNNIDFRVSVRISLKDGTAIAQKVPGNPCHGSPCQRIAVDIAALDPEHTRRRWLFILNKPGEPDAETRVSLTPPPSQAAGKRLEREVRKTLGPFGGPVSIVSGGAFADIDSNDVLPVNEEV
ncbi:hypothetical protein AGMMS49991_05410 [Spirochaetia bacterium]|nr:hypothetical protein AGMMS49991_05410 [Spirochaetia bacterium]